MCSIYVLYCIRIKVEILAITIGKWIIGGKCKSLIVGNNCVVHVDFQKQCLTPT